jgi:hypothetical protein
MARATITKTPTEQLTAAAQSTVDITDATGRTITLRKASPLSQYKLVEAIGDAAQNSVYMGMVFPLLYVAAIDGQPLNPLTSKLQVESLIQRLDEEGIAAVMEGVTKHFGKKTDPDAEKEALKNS